MLNQKKKKTMENKHVYLVRCDFNVNGDTGNDVLTAHESYHDACFSLAEEVKNDLQYGGWLEKCSLFEMVDENHNPVTDKDPVPDFISYFGAKDNEFAPECYEELWIEDVIVFPTSSDTKIEENN